MHTYIHNVCIQEQEGCPTACSPTELAHNASVQGGGVRGGRGRGGRFGQDAIGYAEKRAGGRGRGGGGGGDGSRVMKLHRSCSAYTPGRKFECVCVWHKNIRVGIYLSVSISLSGYLCVFSSIHPSHLLYVTSSTYMYMHMYMYTQTHTHTHTYIHTYIRIYIHTYMYIRMYIHTYVYIHTYIHTYMHACMNTGGESDIMCDIMSHGPVEATFWVYTDFMNYLGGSLFPFSPVCL
jgi:hypothetical protein